MRNRTQLFLGALLVIWGLVALIGAVFHIDVGPICWSVGLILVGVWLVLRPRFTSPGTVSSVSLIGEMQRNGSWQVTNEEFWMGVGDVDLDFRDAVIPAGETKLHIYTFVSDVELLLPRTVGIDLHIAGFVVDANLFGQKRETFLTPVEYTSEAYAGAEQRLRIEMTGFVSSLKAIQI